MLNMINLEVIVNICVLGKMRIAALVSLEDLLFYSIVYGNTVKIARRTVEAHAQRSGKHGATIM